ncbi:C6 transcription factor Pro1 [Microdochium nivale]|nr:C6 transcription factor Pro1 [Microdochium nivale]
MTSSLHGQQQQQHRLRSLRGCWTCRLRRKKCDETRPVCATCSGLEINCQYGESKPAWMDGGRHEKEKAAEIKAMIKVRAGERRDRKWAVMLEPEASATQFESERMDRSSPSPPTTKSTASSSSSTSSTTSRESPDTEPGNYSATPAERPQPASPGGFDKPAEPHSSQSFPSNDVDLEHETNAVMTYLDHVFPFFFPFYRPRLISGTRGWLLFLLLRERSIFHTALSLSSYFTSVAFHTTRNRPALQRETHNACQAVAWHELLKHQELAIRQLQADVSTLSHQSSLRDSIRGLQSIIQLLEFEIAIAKMPTQTAGDGSSSYTSWLPHLNAALNLFNQILRHQTLDNQSGQHPWDAVTSQISHAGPGALQLEFRPPLSNSEMALHFYTARLLYIDILAATALERAPLLEHHHARLLGGSQPAIRLDEFIGLENWTILTTAEVVSLAVWKSRMRSSGQLSVVELVRRASNIEACIRVHILRLAPVLDAATSPHDPTTSSQAAKCSLPTMPTREKIFDPSAFMAGSHAPPFEPPHNINITTTTSGNVTAAAVALHSTIFAHATLIYLSTVVSGMQPSLPEIQNSLAAVLSLFELLPSADCLRTLLWPFAVAGCVAVTPGQRAVFEGIVRDMGDMAVFGPVREALEIIREVWRVRDAGCAGTGSGADAGACVGGGEAHRNLEDWSVAGCLNILGHHSLLV